MRDGQGLDSNPGRLTPGPPFPQTLCCLPIRPHTAVLPSPGWPWCPLLFPITSPSFIFVSIFGKATSASSVTEQVPPSSGQSQWDQVPFLLREALAEFPPPSYSHSAQHTTGANLNPSVPRTRASATAQATKWMTDHTQTQPGPVGPRGQPGRHPVDRNAEYVKEMLPPSSESRRE